VPYDFEIEARGTLQPVARREIFARLNGHVSEVHVEHMQDVTPGMPLVTLDSPELVAKIVEIQGQIQAKQKELDAVEAVRIGDRAALTRPEEKQLLGRKLEIEATLKSLADQLRLYQVKQADLVALSPVAGSVVTLDVHQRLSGRPVQPGDALLTVADTTAEWELEVWVPDHHIGYVTAAREELVRETALGGEGDLRVRFILATDPGVSYYGTLKQIDQRAEVRGDQGNTVLAKVRIRRDELAELRPGASVVARIDCGRRSLGFALFHDLLDFVQSRILFRL
jgi:multidrug efflux pump subunit AcrA (membrane-fusion protein)